MSVNKVILVGNIGKDVETRHLDGGAQVSNFSLATSESYTSKSGEKVNSTQWHNIICWNKLSEIYEKYLKKGQQIYLEGSITYRDWDDKDGNKRTSTEIKATAIQMLGTKPTNQTSEELPTYESPVKNSGLPPSEMAYTNKGNEPEPDYSQDLPF